MLFCSFLGDIVAVWNHKPFLPGFNINFRLGKASKPSKLNQAELEIVVMTPAAMAKAANTVWLAPVEEIVCFYVEAHEELRGTQLEHDFL